MSGRRRSAVEYSWSAAFPLDSSVDHPAPEMSSVPAELLAERRLSEQFRFDTPMMPTVYPSALPVESTVPASTAASAAVATAPPGLLYSSHSFLPANIPTYYSGNQDPSGRVMGILPEYFYPIQQQTALESANNLLFTIPRTLHSTPTIDNSYLPVVDRAVNRPVLAPHTSDSQLILNSRPSFSTAHTSPLPSGKNLLGQTLSTLSSSPTSHPGSIPQGFTLVEPEQQRSANTGDQGFYSISPNETSLPPNSIGRSEYIYNNSSEGATAVSDRLSDRLVLNSENDADDDEEEDDEDEDDMKSESDDIKFLLSSVKPRMGNQFANGTSSTQLNASAAITAPISNIELTPRGYESEPSRTNDTNFCNSRRRSLRHALFDPYRSFDNAAAPTTRSSGPHGSPAVEFRQFSFAGGLNSIDSSSYNYNLDSGMYGVVMDTHSDTEAMYGSTDHVELYGSYGSDKHDYDTEEDNESESGNSGSQSSSQSNTLESQLGPGKKKGLYRCTHCPKKFPTLDLFYNHIEEEKIERPFKCKVAKCPWSKVGFPNRNECSRHIKHQHSKSGYKCTYEWCTKTFPRKDSRNRHEKLVHERPTSRLNRKIAKARAQHEARERKRKATAAAAAALAASTTHLQNRRTNRRLRDPSLLS
ncbi:uncharacterized protein V1516DRAFT_666640 [Lipomyces oligophaga]|uniref:uncharacterized protein n=1 Tax=Lipomyces oligophaga TaxID=45792 RepID=UPI0034CD58B7